mmetsp:Transcript_28548/g.92178  ORF Transcript_28548/g.92178 Transcript_28548/m.92178 type:complete len:81 (-) Transcript_28548:6-248(-)
MPCRVYLFVVRVLRSVNVKRSSSGCCRVAVSWCVMCDLLRAALAACAVSRAFSLHLASGVQCDAARAELFYLFYVFYVLE